MSLDSAPIAAIATAPGRGGIGVVRVSGASVAPVIEAVCGRRLEPRHATYLPFLDASGAAIDRGIAIHYPAPHSYTGEDVLELQGHGGPVVLRLLLARVLQAGAHIGVRLAAPGEFTQRAFLNDRMDLVQAEAVADLIDATTEAAARGAARSLEGEFSRAIHALVDALVTLRMLVEATLDFPEEEIDFLQQADALGRLDAVRAQLAAVLAGARQGSLLRSGLNVVLAGRPNVGKSSLLNALAGQEVAIVTPIAGTTRDRVIEQIQLEGIPLNVIDTAGLREATDEVERIGIARSWQEVSRADVVLHLREAAADAAGGHQAANDEHGGSAESDADIAVRLPATVPVVAVFNKIDLAGQSARVAEDGSVYLSARTGEGVGLLRERLLAIAGWENAGEGVVLARERHLQALQSASAHLQSADRHARARQPSLELFAEELRLAQKSLDAITGEFTADDLLGEIFGRFCIGK